MAKLKGDISARFKMHDLGELKYILGIHVVRERSRRTITLHQSQYADSVLQQYGYGDSNSVATPMAANVKLSVDMSPTSQADILFMQDKDYRGVVGSLMYLMICTRPDLAYLVQQLSQFLTNPGAKHW